MIIRSLTKSIPALIMSTLLLALFYWQFNYMYKEIIDYFREERLSLMFSYLFIYLFGIHIITMTLANLLHYIIKHPAFVFVVGVTLLVFYGFSFKEFYHIIEYFIQYPLPHSDIMGIIFFMILTFGYTLYSIIILFFKRDIPILHIAIFSFVGIGYAIYFSSQYGMPLKELIGRLTVQ